MAPGLPAVASFVLTSRVLGDTVHCDLTARETLLKQRQKAALAKFTGWRAALEVGEAELAKREAALNERETPNAGAKAAPMERP